jgi:hypothetical protein
MKNQKHPNQERPKTIVASSSLFSQLLSLIDRKHFSRMVRETGSEKRSKGFASWDHFVSMLFAQLAQAKSLREINSGLRSCEGKLHHLGMAAAPCRSTLSYANAKRPADLFEKVFYDLLASVSRYAPGKKFRFKSKLYSFDSSVLELCASMFDWAKYRATKGAAKLHLLLDHDGHLPCYAAITEGNVADVTIAQKLKLPKGSLIVMDRGYNDYKMFERWSAEDIGFVTRMKKKADWYVRKELPVKEVSIVRRDTLVEFNCFQAGRTIKGTYRRVVVWLEEKQKEMVLLTNRFDLAAETIAEIYKQRWQIELFFKAIKQNLRIKTFVGTSANAVRIQIWTALISMLLLKLLQFRSQIKWALSNLVALLRWNLFTHKDLWKWIDHPFSALANPPPDGYIQPELDGIVPS